MKPIARHVAGARPGFHADPAIDRLIAMVLALTRETSVLRDRIDTIEILAQEAGWLQPGAIDAYLAPLDVRARREVSREAMIGKVLDILSQEIAELESGETDARYWGSIEAIEKGAL